jgi:hypothetical protein
VGSVAGDAGLSRAPCAVLFQGEFIECLTLRFCIAWNPLTSFESDSHVSIPRLKAYASDESPIASTNEINAEYLLVRMCVPLPLNQQRAAPADRPSLAHQ